MSHVKLAALGVVVLASSLAHSQTSFVNWETPHVYPLDLTPLGSRLLAVNTPDNRLEVFDATGVELIQLPSIEVGLDPVSVRARSETEAWVVNHISDSISIVDLPSGRVRATLDTDDEPCDVVFAGTPQRAYVSCSQVNTVMVFDPINLQLPPARILIDAEDPRAMAVSPDGAQVYVSIFESGNQSTIVGGGEHFLNEFPPKFANDPIGPHGGVSPPPNDGGAFSPPQNVLNPAPPASSIIVKKVDDRWEDDSAGDWTPFVSGIQAAETGRLPGWDLPDRDLAVIQTGTHAVSYVTGLMNVNMAIGVRSTDGSVFVVGTDSTNEIRFEPNLTGTFLRVKIAFVDVSSATSIVGDLNKHLDYSQSAVPQGLKNQSIGDPRGIVWNAAGTRAYITGMGSNNLVIVNGAGAPAGLAPTVELGEGPTGIAIHETAGRLYVLDKFESAISVVELATELEVDRVGFYDPTPEVIQVGRPHLYDTHKTSGLGQIACASCHVDARTDRLAWDLGNPAGDMKPVSGQNLVAGNPLMTESFEDFHPMKGPMLTQTLQDIIGKEPLHWRGDKDNLAEFNGAFVGLQGDESMLTPTEMGEFEDFLATIFYPPNPNRNFDNSLPSDLEMPGHFTTGRFAPPGLPLPNGDATRGLELFLPPNLLTNDELACVTCHPLPTGLGADFTWNGVAYEPFPTGPDDEHHHALSAITGPVKMPQLRGLGERTGFNTTQLSNRAGFGVKRDGSVDSIERFIAQPQFDVQSDQDVADLLAFMLAFSGGELPEAPTDELLNPPGTPGNDSHAAVGTQTTLRSALSPLPGQLALIDAMIALADTGKIGVTAAGIQAGEQRGYAYVGAGMWQSDRLLEVLTSTELQAGAGAGNELTFTVVPAGSETRIGVDRDEDGFLDRDELDASSNPAAPTVVPVACVDPVPAAPTALSASSRGIGLMELDWTDNSVTRETYRVERSPAGTGTFETVTVLPGNTEHFMDIGLDCGASYDYRVSAVTCAGASSVATATGTAVGCQPLTVDAAGISISAGGVQNMTLRAGSEHADQIYVVLGSASGTAPGLFVSFVAVPLNLDAYLLLTLTNANNVPLVNTLNFLDNQGNGMAHFLAPAGALTGIAGVEFHHAFVVFDATTLTLLYASNSEPLTMLP